MMETSRYLWLAAALPLLLACSCKKEEVQKPSLVNTKVTFKPSRNASGTNAPVSLKATDQVRLLDVTSGASDVKSPVSPGGSSATFLFSLPNVSAGDLLLGIYPADAAVTVADGTAEYTVPADQDGRGFTAPHLGWIRHSGDTYSGNAMTLESRTALVRASVQKGSYSIVKAVLQGNGGEALAGPVKVDLSRGTYTATATSVTVTLAAPLDCRVEAQSVPFFVAPVSLPKGVKVTYYKDDGTSFTTTVSEALELTPGSLMDTDPASAGRQLIACGSNKVYLFDEKLARDAKDYKAGLFWEWNAQSEASRLGLAANRMDHIDDAKPVYDNKKLLITSSYGWCILLDIETAAVDFWTTGVTNAHSAEILPGDRIAIACADGYVALFDKTRSNNRIAQYPLTSAHGVVWSSRKQRLYAIGGSNLQVYKLNADWDKNPALELEKTISSAGFVTGMHDMTAVDESTLIIGGNRLALFDLDTERFTGVATYNDVQGFKSVNYNASTGELYYTFGWENYSEGAYTWSSHWIRYASALTAPFSLSLDAQGIIRAEDINMYKVRVYNW